MTHDHHPSISPLYYKRSSSVVTRMVAGECLLVPISGDLADLRQLYTLNETGQAIWNCLAEGVSEQQIVKAVTDAFDVDEKTAAQDVHELLGRLLDGRLIERMNGTTPA